jgi:hypothetical protein
MYRASVAWKDAELREPALASATTIPMYERSAIIIIAILVISMIPTTAAVASKNSAAKFRCQIPLPNSAAKFRCQIRSVSLSRSAIVSQLSVFKLLKIMIVYV